jgi:hypothetical protein
MGLSPWTPRRAAPPAGMQVPRPAPVWAAFDPDRKPRPAHGFKWQRQQRPGERRMAWYDLFTTDYGLMSLIVIVGVIVIGAYMTHKFNELSKQKPGEQKDW